jgi:hypothetical protein
LNDLPVTRLSVGSLLSQILISTIPQVGTMHSAIMTFLGDKRNHDIDGIELKYPKLPGSM